MGDFDFFVVKLLFEGVVYATTASTGLTAIDSATGETLWTNESVTGWVMTVVYSTELIVWSGIELLVIDRDRGDVISRMAVGQVAGIRTDSIENGNLYVVTLEGSVAKFSLK